MSRTNSAEGIAIAIAIADGDRSAAQTAVGAADAAGSSASGRPIPSPAIHTVGLSKRFGATVAVNGLSMTVERGEVFGFLGPNGAGKTTVVKLLLGLVRPPAARRWCSARRWVTARPGHG